MARRGKSGPGAGELRIIAGRWRSRKLQFEALPGLRPTPDRVRETLFNWLQPWVSGSRCLDMYAGSGVLGFEALSRGASEVTFVERQAKIVKCLERQAKILGADTATIICADVLDWLKQQNSDRQFDLVFIDPPFAQGMVQEALSAVVPVCSPSARIYVESEEAVQAQLLPAGWAVEKSGKAASVYFHLIRYSDRCLKESR